MTLVKGSLTRKGALNKIVQIPFHFFKKATDLTANPPAADNNNLTIVTGTYGSAAPVIQSANAKTLLGILPKTRFQFPVPSTYPAGSPINLIISAGMATTIADTSSVLLVDCYRVAAPTVNIGTTAQSINSLTASSKTFVLTTTNVVPGDILDFVLTTIIVDGNGSTAVFGNIYSVNIQLAF